MSPGSDSDESAKPIVPSGARRTDELGNDPSDESAKLVAPSGARRVDELGDGPSDKSKKPVVHSGVRRARGWSSDAGSPPDAPPPLRTPSASSGAIAASPTPLHSVASASQRWSGTPSSSERGEMPLASSGGSSRGGGS